MKARNLVRFTFNALMIVGLLLPYSSPLFTGTSFYFSPGKLVYCAKPQDCWHEIGHVVDDDLGHISQSREFGEALMLYVMYQIKYTSLDSFGAMIFTNPGMLIYSDAYQPYKVEAGSSPQEELYARLYAEVKGDISKLPPLLQRFYKSDQKYNEMYVRLINQKIYINIRSTTMEQIIEKAKGVFAKVSEKVEENKETVIRVSAALVGAVIGAVVATIVANQQDDYLLEEIAMNVDDEDEDSEEQ